MLRCILTFFSCEIESRHNESMLARNKHMRKSYRRAFLRLRGFCLKNAVSLSDDAENASLHPRCVSAPSRPFPASVGVARERAETDSLSRTLTTVYVRSFVRGFRANHAATSRLPRSSCVDQRSNCDGLSSGIINTSVRIRDISSQDDESYFSSLNVSIELSQHLSTNHQRNLRIANRVSSKAGAESMNTSYAA